MKRYKTTSAITLTDGLIALTDAQALVRKSSLKPSGKGVYQVISPVQFKIGEELGFKKTPKAFIGSLEEVEAKKG